LLEIISLLHKRGHLVLKGKERPSQELTPLQLEVLALLQTLALVLLGAVVEARVTPQAIKFKIAMLHVTQQRGGGNKWLTIEFLHL
jgi:hypothetical protein